MRFRYPFQKIVDLKNNEKTQAEWILSQSFGKLRKEEESLSSLLQEKAKVQQNMLQASLATSSISEVSLMQDYVSYLDQRIHSKHQDIASAERQVRQNQQHLTVKMRDEKVWTNAKKIAYQKFLALSLKKEQNELDEIAAVRFSNLQGL